MPLWLQHIIALSLVGLCLGYAIWQGARTLFGKRSRLGSCCGKGCGTATNAPAATEKIHFLPSEMLRKRR